MLLNLVKPLDDRAPHFLRHRGFHSVEDLVSLADELDSVNGWAVKQLDVWRGTPQVHALT